MDRALVWTSRSLTLASTECARSASHVEAQDSWVPPCLVFIQLAASLGAIVVVLLVCLGCACRTRRGTTRRPSKGVYDREKGIVYEGFAVTT